MIAKIMTKGVSLVLGGMLVLLFPLISSSQTEPTVRAIFFNNSAYIVEHPKLPITIDGEKRLSGYPWLEPRIFAVSAEEPPPDLSPTIEVVTSIPPSYLFRPPGRIIPSPFDDATFRFSPTSREGSYRYTSRWPRLLNPRDDRNTVVLTLVSRGKSVLFNTNFDLSYSIDQEIIAEASGIQTMVVQLTPRKDNLSITVRLRSQSTQDITAEMLGEKADPPPSSHTSDSVIWNLDNPPAGKTRTFTVPAVVKNLAYPTRARHGPGLLITASSPPKTLGTRTGARVEFPAEFLPEGIDRVRYRLSQSTTWQFEYADRSLVDLREITELVP